MTALEEFQRRVEQYFQCGQRSEPGGRIILDLLGALRVECAKNEQLHAENERLKSTDPQLETDVASVRADLNAQMTREPALGPLGMGSAEGIKDQSKIYGVWKAMHDSLRALHPELPDLTPIMQGDKLNITVLGDCGKEHSSFEDWQRCEQCEAVFKARQRESVPVAAPEEWFVWAIDRLRQDSKDGNFYRSYRFAQELLTAIDDRGCAIVKKEHR